MQNRKKSPNADYLGQKPVAWALDMLKKRGIPDVSKKDRMALREAFEEIAASGGQLENGPLESQVTLPTPRKRLDAKINSFN